MRISVLGPMEVHTDPDVRVPIPAAKQRAILACVALNANRTVTVDALGRGAGPMQAGGDVFSMASAGKAGATMANRLPKASITASISAPRFPRSVESIFL